MKVNTSKIAAALSCLSAKNIKTIDGETYGSKNPVSKDEIVLQLAEVVRKKHLSSLPKREQLASKARCLLGKPSKYYDNAQLYLEYAWDFGYKFNSPSSQSGASTPYSTLSRLSGSPDKSGVGIHIMQRSGSAESVSVHDSVFSLADK